MAKGLSPWRALRPVLLAGAATLTWLTLSSTAATADSADSGSLLGGVTSSVSSLASPAGQHPAVSARRCCRRPLSRSTVRTSAARGRPLASSADQLIAAVPVVNEVVPAGTVSAVAVPVAVVADDATAGLVETVAPPLVEAVPVLEPVLQPVSDLVTGAAPLPVTLPSVPDSGSVAYWHRRRPGRGPRCGCPVRRWHSHGDRFRAASGGCRRGRVPNAACGPSPDICLP